NPKEFFILDEFEGADFHHEHFDHENVSSTLFLSYVLFRHGNRTPDSVQEMYPNDPYLIETYYPTGLGQLTNVLGFQPSALQHSGLEVSTFRHIYNLYFGLSTEEEWGFSLPDWTQPIWPRKVTAVAIHEYYVQMANDRMWKLASGHLLRKILHDTETKIAQLSKGCKIHLYSAHENNVVQLLILLGVFWPHIPCYGAHVILEVHHIEEEFGIKVFYQNWEVEHPELLQIPGCDVFCPLDQFRELFSKYMPEDDECGY
uniref:acid phosphatase n=1 Tax=Dendroctonus ponderosae TaxID=77166 RepID=A0AAR5QGY8_DENPD